MAALSLGMLGFVLSLLGMECTFIGGKDKSKYKKIYTGGWCHIISGKYFHNPLFKMKKHFKTLISRSKCMFVSLRYDVGKWIWCLCTVCLNGTLQS